MINKSFLTQVYYLTKRSLIASFRNPFVYIPNFVISLFFLFVYSGGVNAITQLPNLENVNYVAFILPISIVSAAIGASTGAVESLVKDIENGYFTRLYLAPINKIAIVLGPILTGMIHLIIQSAILLLISLPMGVSINNGLNGFLTILLLVMGIGLAFTGYATAIALISKSSQAVQMGTMIFFPMLFLSSTFVPLEMIDIKWLSVAAKINPTTYIFEGIRALLIENWNTDYIIYGLLIGLVGTTVSLIIATLSSKNIFE
ncbi:MAG: ABC transporter permease [Thermotogota bacterium]